MHVQIVRRVAAAAFLPFIFAAACLAPSSAQASAEVTATSMGNQCSTPVAARVGAWVCVASNTDARIAINTEARIRPSVAGAVGYCSGAGCWERYDDFHSDYEADNLAFGYGKQALGVGRLYVDWRLSGSQNWADNVQFSTTINTQSDVFEGDLLNAAPGAAGAAISGKYSPYTIGNCAANTVCSWKPNGYKAYDNTTWDHSGTIEVVWGVPNYPGHWYAYVKSISSHTQVRNSNNALYRFAASPGLPASPANAGWHSN